jgi:[ribosomal protein S18]-alanine N-acetyltransferase
MPVLFSKDVDLEILAEIHACVFAEPWTTNVIDELLAMPGSFAFFTGNGFVLARIAADEAEILTLAVRPDSRRRGQGTALVRAAADHAHSLGAGDIFLEVASSNTAARALYAGLGCAEVGKRKGYYAFGRDKREDALILRSKLPLSPLGKSPRAG